jgi:hypothetical protein
MVKSLPVLLLLCVKIAVAQPVQQFNGRWAFTGLRTTIFKVLNQKLYVGMLDYTDTSNFNRFIQQLPLDSSIYTEARVIQQNDTTIIEANFISIDHSLKLLYTSTDSNHIWYTGDVFFDSSTIIAPDRNCSLVKPACINRLYDQRELKNIMRMKTSVDFTRDDAFEFLARLNGKLKSKCNRCYAGFTDAYMNEILIDMGFNPIIKRAAVKSVWYNTSGFTFYIKSKFSNDQRLVKLTEYIFDSYLKIPK